MPKAAALRVANLSDKGPATETVDLSRPLGFGGGDRIVRHESAEKWQVEPLRFMQVA